MPRKGLAPGQRRRDRDAAAALRRIEHQRATLATRYAQADGPLARLVAVTGALRAAAQPGAHQIPRTDVERLLRTATSAVHAAVDDLHQRQRARAERVLATATERRSRHDQPDDRIRPRSA